MPRMQVTIRDRSSLPRLLQQKHFLVHLELPHLTPVESVEWERRIQRSLSACGCGTAAAFLLLALTGYTATWWLGCSLLPSGTLARLGLGLLVVAGATGAGKVLGLLRARAQLKRAVTDLDRMVSERARVQ